MTAATLHVEALTHMAIPLGETAMATRHTEVQMLMGIQHCVTVTAIQHEEVQMHMETPRGATIMATLHVAAQMLMGTQHCATVMEIPLAATPIHTEIQPVNKWDLIQHVAELN